MNSITVAGILGKDAEIRHMNNGDPVASFSVADSMGRDKGTIWWRCSLFGKRAESLAPYLLKGAHVTISGTVSERSYTDKNGQERTAQEVRVQDVALQGGKREGAAPAPAARKPTPAGNGFDDLDDGDGIPF